MTCRGYKCEAVATTIMGNYKYCEPCARRLNAKRRHQARKERAEQRFEARMKAAYDIDPIWGPLSDLASNAETWTREEFEQYCREWRYEFESHLTKDEPSRARVRNLHRGRAVLLG